MEDAAKLAVPRVGDCRTVSYWQSLLQRSQLPDMFFAAVEAFYAR